jgi:molybdenum cofactor synthesis domain-containing protein
MAWNTRLMLLALTSLQCESPMISYRDALNMLLSTTRPLGIERVPLTAALHRVLATPLVAPYDMPPFDQSLMDGYALRSADTRAAVPQQPVRLPVGQTLTAGDFLEHAVPPQQAIRIMTGATMPRGVDAVVKLEDSEVEDGHLLIRQPVLRRTSVQRRGAEVRRGSTIASAGVRLTPQGIGMALSLGLGAVEVRQRPRIALVAPGDELLPPGAPLQPGKKWCSNMYALELRAQEIGAVSVHVGIVPDTLAALAQQLSQHLGVEVIVILGASGRGDHDYAARAMLEVGAELVFRGVATSPGRSITVARHQQTLLIGLPGSPFAAFVGFEIFVWPVLRVLLGQKPVVPPTLKATLTAPVRIRRGATHFLPARVQSSMHGCQVTPCASLVDLSRTETEALGLIIAPPHRRALPAGTPVRVQVLTP